MIKLVHDAWNECITEIIINFLGSVRIYDIMMHWLQLFVIDSILFRLFFDNFKESKSDDTYALSFVFTESHERARC